MKLTIQKKDTIEEDDPFKFSLSIIPENDNDREFLRDWVFQVKGDFELIIKELDKEK